MHMPFVMTIPSSRLIILVMVCTLCWVKRIKLKSGAPPLHWKNWDVYKVYTTSACHVEWAKFERFPENSKIQTKKTAIVQLEKEIENSAINDNLSELEKIKYELNALQQQKCFKLSPTKASAFVRVTLDDNVNENAELKGVTMT